MDNRLDERKRLIARIDHLEMAILKLSFDADAYVYVEIQKLLEYQPTELFHPVLLRKELNKKKKKGDQNG